MVDDASKPGRAGSMSDADRSLAGHKERVAARAAQAAPEAIEDEDSLPVITDAGDGEPTPVLTPPRRRRRRLSVQQFAEEIKTEVRDLRRAIDESIRAELNNRAELAERLVKVETHLLLLGDLGDDTAAAELLKLRADLTSLRVTLIGENGKNGKIGTLTEKAEKGPRFIKRTLAAAVAAVLGAVIPAALFMRGMVADSAAERATTRAELEAAKAERGVLQSQVLLLFRLVGGRAGRGGAIDPLAPTGVPP